MRPLGCLIGLLAVLWPDYVAACTCLQRKNVCQTYSDADVVFVGEVVSASVPADFFDRWTEMWRSGLIAADLKPENRERQVQAVRRIVEEALGRGLSPQEQQALANVQSGAELSLILKQLEPSGRTIRFRLIENFKGTNGPITELSTPIPQGANCVIGYAVGETYLVYGSRTSPYSQNLSAGGVCGRSRRASGVEDEIAYLRRLREGDRTSTVFGFVRVAPEPGPQPHEVLEELSKPNPAVGEPVAGARVRLKGEQEWITSTDNHGDFEFPDVPQGVYQINASLNDVPAGGPREVRLGDGACSEERLWLHREIGLLAGTVSEKDGAPVSGQTIDVIPALDQVRPQAGAALRPTTNNDGEFETVLPVGAYFVGINIADPPRPTRGQTRGAGYASAYYPGVRDKDAAPTVSISEWQSTRLQFTVEPLAERYVRGIVVWPNGDPASEAVVLLEEPNRAVHAVDRAGTSTDGSFELTGFVGIKYRIVCSAVHPVTAQSYQAIGEGADENVRLVLQPLER